MSQVKIEAELRTDTGKGFARKARQAGRVPAVIYGWQIEPQTLELDGVAVDRFLGTAAAGRLLDLQVGDEEHTVLVKEVQRDPARGTLLHVDFHKVRLDQAVETSVTILIVGEAEREADGGVLALNMHEVLVSCLPTNIPDSVTVDVKDLAMGDTVTVGDLALPEGVEPIEDLESAVVSIVQPRMPEEDEEETDVDEEVEGAEEEKDDDADEAETEEE